MAGHGSLIQTYWLHPRAWNQRKLHAQNLPVCKAACKVVVAKESDWPFEKCEEKKNTRCFGDTDTVWFFLLWSIVLSLVRDVWVLLCIYICLYNISSRLYSTNFYMPIYRVHIVTVCGNPLCGNFRSWHPSFTGSFDSFQVGWTKADHWLMLWIILGAMHFRFQEFLVFF